MAVEIRLLQEAAMRAAVHWAPAAEPRVTATAAALVAAAPATKASVLCASGTITGVLLHVKLAGSTFMRLLLPPGTFYCPNQRAATVPRLPQQQTDPKHPVRPLTHDTCVRSSCTHSSHRLWQGCSTLTRRKTVCAVACAP